MAIYDDYIRKYIYGMPGQGIGQATQGLLGRGGEYGGGFVQRALASPDVIQGIGLLSAGMRGKGVQEALQTQAKTQALLQPKAKLVRARDVKTGKDVFVTQRQILDNPGLYQPIPQQTMMGETEEQKYVGKVYGKQFENIMEGASRASENSLTIAQAKELLNQPDLKTGIDAGLRTTAQRVANAVGLDINVQNVPAAQLLQQTTGELVLTDLGKFKGAISDGERKFAVDKNPNLGQTKEGLALRLEILEKTGQINIKYAEAAEDWRQRNGGLGNKDRATGQSWSQFTKQFQKENPLIDEKLRERVNTAAGRQPDFGMQKDIKVIGGKTYFFKDGKWYEQK